MSDEIGATGTQADPGTQPPAGNAEAQAAEASGETQQPETISLEEAKKLRAEASSLRRRLKDYEDKDKAAAEARLSEQERLQNRAATLERERDDAIRANQEMRVQSAVVNGAARLGFADPQLAMRVIDHAAIDYDADGSPSNVDDLLSSAAKAYPYLVKGRGAADVGVSAASGSPIYTREQLRDPAFYAANQADIFAAAREGRIRG